MDHSHIREAFAAVHAKVAERRIAHRSWDCPESLDECRFCGFVLAYELLGKRGAVIRAARLQPAGHALLRVGLSGRQ